MGAFLIAKQSNTGFVPASALKVFETMGLNAPNEFIFGDWKLWSWKKIRSSEDHFVIKGNAIRSKSTRLNSSHPRLSRMPSSA